MNEILELQTGQVIFISGLLAGFSLSIAVQIYRTKDHDLISTINFILFTVTSLLFLIALYVDVALMLRIVSIEEFSDTLLARISSIRIIGTSIATSALFLFIASIGLIGWLQSRLAGIVTSLVAVIAIVTIWLLRDIIFAIA